MRYIEVLLIWNLINLYLFFVAYVVKFNLNYFLTYFFIGVFLILIYGFIEVIKKDSSEE